MVLCCNNTIVLRIVRLHNHSARLFASPRSSRHLRQKLKGAFRCGIVGQIEDHVRRQHAHCSHIGKIQTLGHHLRPNQNLRFTAGKPLQYLIMGIFIFRRVQIHPIDDSPGPEPSYLFLHQLRTRTHKTNIVTAAIGAHSRQWHHKITIVAFGHVLFLVVGQRNRAFLANQRIPALPTDHRAGKASAVQKKDNLLPSQETLLHSLPQLLAKHTAISALEFFCHIHNLHCRQGLLFCPLVQCEQCARALRNLIITLHRRCRAAQKQQTFILLHPLSGHLPRVITRIGLRLLKGRFVFLIHDNQTQSPHRRKHRAAHTHHNARLSLVEPLPSVKPFSVGQIAVQNLYIFAQHCAKPAD